MRHLSSPTVGSGSSYYYHFGVQGETRRVTNTNTPPTSAANYAYNAWGIPYGSVSTFDNPYQYGGKVGYYPAGNTGAYIAGARVYHPYIMRWLQRDPIGFDGGYNLYEYVGSSPVNYIDPTGNEKQRHRGKEGKKKINPTINGKEVPPVQSSIPIVEEEIDRIQNQIDELECQEEIDRKAIRRLRANKRRLQAFLKKGIERAGRGFKGLAPFLFGLGYLEYQNQKLCLEVHKEVCANCGSNCPCGDPCL